MKKSEIMFGAKPKPPCATEVNQKTGATAVKANPSSEAYENTKMAIGTPGELRICHALKSLSFGFAASSSAVESSFFASLLRV
jgi:hypothetical protein